MSENKKFRFFRDLRKKHRLSYRDQHDGEEVWWMHISPLEMIGAFIALLLILFIIILSAVAYTPVLNLIPGYSGNKAREVMIQNIMRVDSIERRLNEMQLYATDVSVIMDGRTPVVRDITQAGDTLLVDKIGAVQPNAADSALRAQMEGTGIYGLNNPQMRRQARSDTDLVPPVRGVVATYFSPRDGRYGVGLATAANQEVLAADEGTVIFSAWIPDEGYVVQIQHANNLISVYKNTAQTLNIVGARVKAGEVIAYTGEGLSGEEGKGLLEFQLWLNGSPVDPENYIIF